MVIFISYSGKNAAIYAMLVELLKKEGIDLWTVSSMSLGKSLAAQLQEAISKCNLCVFIATRQSIRTPWCLAELGAFWGTGKQVILYMVDASLDELMLPPQFRQDLHTNSISVLVEEIKKGEVAAIASSTERWVCRKIKSRAELYEECTNLIKTSHSIFDTTWGKRASSRLSVKEMLATVIEVQLKSFSRKATHIGNF